ncbi:C4-dicarboxylate ABC transporter permease [Sporosarcina aquimarina]|uniref:YfcC family protein n=1 Tax=Sporosarcina aquimarina TaxID=114975 RepID=UPI00203B70B2|nr:C4-dicarboxylate ABC transporter permease [Sporosarcina aquimarina]MCM3758536.1 C4-dicarboxylate ABC transporter permease [Sporosarcina aquimarina]
MTKPTKDYLNHQEQETPAKGINAFALMFIVIVIMTVLTYIVPAGQYDRIEQDGRTIVDANSFEFVDRTPVGLLQMFNSVHLGLMEGAHIILFVFLFGGALGIMQATGAIDSFIKVVAARFGKREIVLIPLLVLIFALLGTLIGSAEDTLVYIAIIVPMTMALRMDALTGFAIVMLGTMATGFVTGITNPFNVAVAQSIAELPIYSGMGLRIAIFIVFYLLTVVFIYRHAMKVKKNPAAGIYGKFDPKDQVAIDMEFKMSKRHLLALLVLLANFIALVVGVIKFGWYISEIGGIFLFSAIIMGIIGKLSMNKMADGFVSGAREMVAGALIIGIAQTILVVTKDGGLLDTILYFSAGLVGQLPASINAIGMFFMQLVINFIVPSGSGQAALTMPLMTPLADLIGVTRQTAVFAFQMGDGISNTVIPTSGVLLAGLAIAGIPFTQWVKWVFPYVLIQVGITIIFLIIAQAINYGPF